MIDKDYTFGTATVYCDCKGCPSERNIEGFDNHPPQFDEILAEMKDYGWVSKRLNGEWLHFCGAACCKNYLKESEGE